MLERKIKNFPMENNLYQNIEKNAFKSPNRIAINYQNNVITYSGFLKNIDLFVEHNNQWGQLFSDQDQRWQVSIFFIKRL